MKRSAAHVHVRNPETGRFHRFATGDELPNWAVKLITNPAVFESEDDERGEVDEPDDGLPSVKDKKEVWEEVAREHGLDPAGLNKDDVIHSVFVHIATAEGLDTEGLSTEEIREALREE